MRERIFTALLVSTLVYMAGCGGSSREVDSSQIQKRGDGLAYAVNEEDPFSGKAIEYYESGQKKEEVSFRHGVAHGTTTTWFRNGQKREEIEYDHGHITGWSYWAEDGRRFDDEVVDIDGNTYRTMKIGNQVWMAENLKVTHYRNGDAIPNVTDNTAWGNLTTGAYCNYNNDINNVATYGRLYNWYAVADSRGIAPTGWHVPSDEEWKQLEMYLGMSQAAADSLGLRGTDEGGKLKETGTTHWYSPNTGATNESGFTALPGCGRVGTFDYMGYFASFWSSTELNSLLAWSRTLNYYGSQINRTNDYKQGGVSVRCVRD